MPKFCTVCGTALTAQAKFCSECGQPTSPHAAQTVRPTRGMLPVVQVKVMLQAHGMLQDKFLFLRSLPKVIPVKIIANAIEVVSGKSEIHMLGVGDIHSHSELSKYDDAWSIRSHCTTKTPFFEKPVIDFLHISILLDMMRLMLFNLLEIKKCQFLCLMIIFGKSRMSFR